MTVTYHSGGRLQGISTGHTTAGTPYDASNSNLTYAEGHDFSSYSTNSIAMASSPDGTHFYVNEEGGGTHHFELSTAWDISTAVYQQEYTHGLTNPKGLFFSADGTKMFQGAFNAGTIYRYPLSTAWDISSSSVGSSDQSYSTSQIQDLFFSADGTKMFWSNNSGVVSKLSLGTAWTINSNTSTDGTVNPPNITGIGAVIFSADGTKMFLGGWDSSGYIIQYALSTAWQISSGVSFTQNYTESGSQMSDMQGMVVTPTGNKFFVLDQTNDYIRQYNADTLDSDYNSATNVPDYSRFEETDTRKIYSRLPISKSGCLAYYKLDETSGVAINTATTANGYADGLGSSVNGTQGSAGATQGSTGKLGNCYTFDGADNKEIDCNNALITGTGDFSTALWINGDTISGSMSAQTFLKNHGNTVNTGGFEYYLRYGIPTFYTSSGWQSIGSALSSNTWYHLTLVRESGVVSHYVDGVSQGTFTISHNITGDNNLFIGGANNYALSNFDGKMDDISIWNRALTTSEISALYNSGTGSTVDTANDKKWNMEPTFRDDLTSYPTQTEADSSWVSTNTRYSVDPATDRINFDYDMSTTNYAVAYDLGVGNVSDEAWVMRCRIEFTTLTSANDNLIHFGIADADQTNTDDTPEDNIGFFSMYQSSVRRWTLYGLHDDALYGSPAENGIDNGVAIGAYYMELIRNNSTLVTLNVYSDADYSDLLETITEVINSAVQNLRYIKFNSRTLGGSGVITGHIKDVEFYNGVNTVN